MIAYYLTGLLSAFLFMYCLNRHFDDDFTYGDIALIFILALFGPLLPVAMFFLVVIFVILKIVESDIWHKPIFKGKK